MIASLLTVSFAAPWALLALPALPLLWWLLRVTPPAPRREVFPAIRLLLGLDATAETPAHTPVWLLALRMLAAGLVIVGVARPVLDAGRDLAGSGPLLLVIDDGWAAAADWPLRMAAAQSALDRAERQGVRAALLTTAPAEDGGAPVLTPPMPVADLRARLAALRPKPWPADHAAAAAALAASRPATVVYLADGLGEGAGFGARLAAIGHVEELRDPTLPLLLRPPRALADRLVADILTVPATAPRTVAVLAQSGDGSGDGRTLARVPATIAAGADRAEATIRLPPELRNSLTRLVLEAPSSASHVVLLDERWRRRPVGLLAGNAGTADTPLTGPLFYLRRALAPTAELREGDLKTLLARQLSVLILADHVVAEGPEQTALADWVDKGGTLIRFAGPAMAEHADALLPVKLLGGDRQLGGSMSWTKPPSLAPFDAGSPFQGLPVPAEVRITRQVLAAPVAARPADTNANPVWARLADGTPLVTQAPWGAGRIVLFHVTANADWSDLPLSGLYVDMLRRLVAQANGVPEGAVAAEAPPLAPAEILDGFGQPGAPNAAATAIEQASFVTTLVSARHPPGLYGPVSGRRALNLGVGVTRLSPSPAIAGAREEALGKQAQARPVAPFLIAAALALLAFDLLISLRLRGLWRAPALLLLVALAAPAQAAGAAAQIQAAGAAAQIQAAGAAARTQAADANPALVTKLAYIITDDAQVDGVSMAGLAGLSDYVNRRTNAALGEPAGVRPGSDDLSFYPLLYWPVTADAPVPSGAAVAALNDYMSHGGIILIDTRNGGSGQGFAPGADAALARAGVGLAVPALTPLTSAHVLARSFYLLQDFPGRYDGDTVWVQRDEDRANDSVSPVIIGGHDWAAAWAIDAEGHNPYATLPGGARQRTLAYRFGVNLVMYALTGNYKGDQVHVPALLERLGQ